MTVTNTRNYVLLVLFGILAIALVVTGFASADENPTNQHPATPIVEEVKMDDVQMDNDVAPTPETTVDLDTFEWTQEQIDAVRDGRLDVVIDEVCVQYGEDGSCVAIPGLPLREVRQGSFSDSQANSTYAGGAEGSDAFAEFEWTQEQIDAVRDGRLDEVIDEICVQYGEDGSCVAIPHLPTLQGNYAAGN